MAERLPSTPKRRLSGGSTPSRMASGPLFMSPTPASPRHIELETSKRIKMEPGSETPFREIDTLAHMRTGLDLAAVPMDVIPKAELRTAQHSDLYSLPSYPSTSIPFKSGRPSIAAYHNLYPIAEDIPCSSVAQFLKVFDEHKSHGFSKPSLEHVYRRIKDRQLPSARYPPVKPFGIAGQTGAGKSNLLCALLERIGIAKVSDVTRGTNVPHLYIAAPESQTHRFVVKVRLFSRSVIDDRVSHACTDIFALHDAERARSLQQEEERRVAQEAGELVDEDSEDDSGDFEMTDKRSRHNTAIEFICEVLCDRAEFRTLQATAEWFETHGEVRDEIVTKLQYFVRCFVQSREQECVSGEPDTHADQEELIETYTAMNEDELGRIFDRVSGRPRRDDTAQPVPHVWPLVEEISVYLHHDLLQAGVTLADIPGAADNNQAILSAAKDFIKSRIGSLLIVAPLLRCDTGAELQSMLDMCYRLNKLNDVELVISKIDEANPIDNVDERSPLWGVVQEVQQTQKRLEEYNFEMFMKAAEQGQSAGEEMMSDFQGLREQLARAKAEKRRLEVNMKCREVENKMRNKLRETTGSRAGKDLPVHFTSTKDFVAHLTSSAQPGALARMDTGIDGIRQFLYLQVAQGRFEELQKLMTELSSYFGLVLDSFNVAQAKEYEGLRDAVQTYLRKADKDIITCACKPIGGLFEETVMKSFNGKDGTWPIKGQKLVNRWATSIKNARNLHSFFVRQGTWRYKVDDGIWQGLSWNDEIHKIFKTPVVGAFEKFDEHLRALEATLSERINSRFQGILAFIHELGDIEPAEQQRLVRELRIVQSDTETNCIGTFQDFEQRIDDIRNEATHEDVTGHSYVAGGMKQTYEDGAGASYSGSRAGRIGKLNKTLSTKGKDSIFEHVANRVQEDFAAALQDFERQLEEYLEESRQEVLKVFTPPSGEMEPETEDEVLAAEEICNAASAAITELARGTEYLRQCKLDEEKAKLEALSRS